MATPATHALRVPMHVLRLWRESCRAMDSASATRLRINRTASATSLLAYVVN